MIFEKRGQLTIFVILGIVIVVSIIGYYVYQNGASDRYFSEAAVGEGVSEIEDYMVDCLTYVAESSLLDIMIQGGYYERLKKLTVRKILDFYLIITLKDKNIFLV